MEKDMREFAISFSADYKRQRDNPPVYLAKVRAENPYDAFLLVKESAGFKIYVLALLELPCLKSHIQRSGVSEEYECLRLINVIQDKQLEVEGKIIVHWEGSKRRKS